MRENHVRLKGQGLLERDDELRKWIDGLLDDGVSYRDIQRITHVGIGTIGRYGRSRGRIPRPPKPQNPLSKELERAYKAFEAAQTRENWEKYHDALHRYEDSHVIAQ